MTDFDEIKNNQQLRVVALQHADKGSLVGIQGEYADTYDMLQKANEIYDWLKSGKMPETLLANANCRS